MSDPLTLATLSSSILKEGVKFVYDQVGELLKERRERRARKTSPHLPPGTDVLSGTLAPLKVDHKIFDLVADDMDVLHDMLFEYLANKKPVTPEDVHLIRIVSALRGLLEVVYEQRFTFKTEDRQPSGPVVTGAIDIEEVRGRAVAVRVGHVSGSAHIQARAKVARVGRGGEVVGTDIDRIG
jgi:hypothetical protein